MLFERNLLESIISLSFIDEYKALGVSATLLAYENALIPNENTAGNRTTYKYSSDEIYFNTYSNSGITIAADGEITYSSNKTANKNYYILGSVTDASLASYAPTMGINDYAEVYQYLNINKAKGLYGSSQTTNDTSLLNTAGTDTVYLYLPYYVDSNGDGKESEGDEYEIVLVKMVVSNGVKTLSNVYKTNSTIFSGNEEATPDATLTGVTLENIHSSSNTFTMSTKTYKISEYCGQPGNSSLYMNYIGDPKDGHFWYVSYAIFSESYLNSKSDTESVDYYHISIIDKTNNIYFTIKVNIPVGFTDNAIYMSINYITYDGNNPVENSVAVYAIESDETRVFYTQYQLAMLPTGYYSFTLELPLGYKVTYTASRTNKKDMPGDDHNGEHTGTYLPPSSVVPIEIDLEFNVLVDTSLQGSTNTWGMGTTSTRTITAELA